MTVEFDVAVSEVGLESSLAIDELLKRRLGGRPVAEYAYGDPIAWDVIADSGWDLVGASEENGGADVELRDLIAIAQVVGRWLPPIPIMNTIMTKRWSSAARDADGPVTVAVRIAGGRVVVPFGATPGIDLLANTESGQDAVSASSALVADDYAPSLRAAEGGEPTGFTRESAREFALVWAAEAVGCGERMLDVAVEYVKQRQQFGQPIGRFQAVKHHLADALISVQEAESAVLWGAAEAPKLTPALDIAFSSSLRAVEIAVQAHGGLGFTWEFGLHVYLRHIVSLRLLAMGLAEIVDKD
jgi:alkylation response protein AidB-like acyl-CoA dehydrogenase